MGYEGAGWVGYVEVGGSYIFFQFTFNLLNDSNLRNNKL